MSLPKTEIGWMRGVALVAIIVLTLALASLNISGAWLGSHGNLPFTLTILGAELLAAVCLVLILGAPTWPRKIVGAIVFTVLVWVCVENGKQSVERSFSDVFVDSADALDAKAVVASTSAEAMKATAPADLLVLKEEKARLEVERKLMVANDPKGIEQAQASLKSMGLYALPIDGIRGPDTEAAMLSRGNAIRDRLAELDAMIGGDAGTTPAEAKANAAIDLKTKAEEVRARTVWMNALLIGLEGARSFGLWCFVIWSTAVRSVAVDPDVFKDLQRDADELARRKANLGDGVEKANKTKNRKKNREQSLKMIADQRAESVKREDVAASSPDVMAEPEAEAGEPALDLTDEVADDASASAENDDLPDEQEKAA